MQATQLFGLYRNADVSAPDIFLAGVVAILQQYPQAVVEKVCAPSGLPSQSKWLPSIAEIKEACDKVNGTWRPPDGMLSPSGYVYDSSKPGGINFLAEPRNRRFFYED